MFSALDPWLQLPRAVPHAPLRLFCFPYAGSGASLFYPWLTTLPDTIELCPVQLPGRENRFAEACDRDIRELVPTLVEALKPYLDRPFAFFGHSLGALLAFEVARMLSTYGLVPAHLFVSAARAPHLPAQIPTIAHLADAELLEQVQQRYRGFSSAALQEPELLRLYLPVLRADLALFEGYRYTVAPPLTCPLTVFGGWQDDLVSYYDLQPWKMHTMGVFSLRMFDGEHFFLRARAAQLVGEVVEQLADIPLRRCS